MGAEKIKLCLCIILVTFLTALAHAANGKLEVPPCPSETKRIFVPDPATPTWTACKDKGGLYQGLLIQLSNHFDVLRIAGVKDSMRNGKEIRFGATGFIEERFYQAGHLEQKSFIFKSELSLAKALPQPMTAQDWAAFSSPSDTSLLKVWLKQEPFSTITFKNGRIVRIEFDKKSYSFKTAPDGRTFALDHPEMKKSFFIDPQSFWNLNGPDLTRALVMGFGSCKAYAGPSGRFSRHYDHLLYKRESSETKHNEKLKEIRNRFIQFCVPEDLQAHLGTLECPPPLPSTRPPHICSLAISDQIHIPYEPKYFKFEYTVGLPPEVMVKKFTDEGLWKFLSNSDANQDLFQIDKTHSAILKKTTQGVFFRVVPFMNAMPAEIDQKSWWEWHQLPGF